MSIFERLAEVRIQDWNRRQARGEVPAEPDAPLGTGEILETQLLADAIDLLERGALSGRGSSQRPKHGNSG